MSFMFLNVVFTNTALFYKWKKDKAFIQDIKKKNHYLILDS